MTADTIGREEIWHDVECGAYAADLGLWEELARESGGPVLELGVGTGRVALRLAAAGFDVAALDSSAGLVAELRRRATRAGLDIDARVGDAREVAFEARFAAIVAPMQLVHLLGGADGRAAMFAACARQLRPGGVLAAALLAADAVVAGAAQDADAPLPDVREIDGWVYSSLPLEVAATATGFEVRRLRQLVSPAGELTERVESIHLDRLDAAEFECEAAAAGFRGRERLEVPATADHVGSVICVLEVGS